MRGAWREEQQRVSRFQAGASAHVFAGAAFAGSTFARMTGAGMTTLPSAMIAASSFTVYPFSSAFRIWALSSSAASSRLAGFLSGRSSRIFRMALMSFTGIRLRFSHAFTPLSHPPARSVLPFPLYAPFFKVANKVCKLL